MFFPTRWGGRAAAVITVVSACALVTAGSAVALPSNCVQSTATVTCTFSATGHQQSIKIPAHITVVTVSARGAAGTGTWAAPGGPEGTADGVVPVPPSSLLYVEVGTSAGWNGGGPGTSSGAPGGGASDVRTVSCGTNCAAGGDPASLASRLIVAGGGGSSGQPNDPVEPGFPGGAGGGSGLNGDGGNSPFAGIGGGGGGGAGGSGAGGAGGSGSDGAANGGDGALGVGGGAGVGGTADGGGGGGGYYGGGGGGGGSVGAFCPNPFFCLPFPEAGGGGGGGSSYAPGGTTGIDDPSLPALVTISYSLAPTNTSPPTISGTATRGATLTGTPGTWSPIPTGFSYQWLQCDRAGNNCAPLAAGGHTLTQVVQASAVDHSLELQVTASNASGSTQATSAPYVISGPVPTNISAPSISGTAQVGQQLAGTNGSWTHAPTSYAYQWETCDSGGNNCSALSSGGHGLNLTVPAAAIGHTLELQVVASNADGPSSPATSGPSSVVPGDLPANAAAPTVSGTAAVGDVLTGTRGSWTGQVSSYNYQWERCDSGGANCSPTGGTGLAYTVHPADGGHTIELWVTASNGAGTTAPAMSSPTVVVPVLAPTNNSVPTISGSGAVGQTLTGTHGIWAGSGITYTYQWLRCDSSGNNCAPVPGGGGHGLAYVVPLSAAGFTLELAVTATNGSGSNTATSSYITISTN